VSFRRARTSNPSIGESRKTVFDRDAVKTQRLGKRRFSAAKNSASHGIAIWCSADVGEKGFDLVNPAKM